MADLNLHEDLMNIDLLSEGVDWFSLGVTSESLEIAKRVKASPTKCLKQIIEGAVCDSPEVQRVVVEFAKKEFASRIANENSNPNGDPHYSKVIAGYDKFDKNLHEVLSADDPVEKWIADFIKSDNPKFEGKSKKERINMALGAFYASKKKEESVQEKRDQRIVTLATKSTDENIVKYFIESTPGVATKAVLEIKDLYESLIFDLVEAAITVGSEGAVKCVQRWGACDIGKVYVGVWKPAARPTQLKLDLDYALPRATAHPIIFFDKNTNQLTLPKQFELL